MFNEIIEAMDGIAPKDKILSSVDFYSADDYVKYCKTFTITCTICGERKCHYDYDAGLDNIIMEDRGINYDRYAANKLVKQLLEHCLYKRK